MILSVRHNTMAINAYRNLQKANFDMGKSMEKLSSGFRINTASDSPSDLIMSEQLRSRIEGLERAIRNTTETGNILDITDGALGEVQNILRSMRQLTIQSMNTGVRSADQIAADQAEMDVALQSINRIVGTANYAGRKLLDNLGLGGTIVNGNIVMNGQNLTDLQQQDNATKFSRKGFDPNNLLQTEVVQPEVNTEPVVDENGLLLADKTFTIKGKTGSQDDLATYTFSAGTSMSEIVAKLREFNMPAEEAAELDAEFTPPAYRFGEDINQVGMSTDTLNHMQGLGDAEAEQFIADYMKNYSPAREFQEGQIFDISKLSEGDRKLFDLSQNLMNMSMDNLGGLQTLTGYDENGLALYDNLTLNDMFSGGAASLENDPDAAMKIIEQAMKGVMSSRAQIAATRIYGVQASENLLRSELESYTRCESTIRDTDYAAEMVELSRTKLVSQVGTQMLKAANEYGQSILNLLA